jgi:hypothetical protein|tara:strand:+ start:37 stop:207 length:171 start_codon:yes stop_codon:yes gene_type:complete
MPGFKTSKRKPMKAGKKKVVKKPMDGHGKKAMQYAKKAMMFGKKAMQYASKAKKKK